MCKGPEVERKRREPCQRNEGAQCKWSGKPEGAGGGRQGPEHAGPG